MRHFAPLTLETSSQHATRMISFLVSLLVFVLIAAVILWLVRAVLGAIPGGAPFTNIAYGIVALILLLLFLSEIGWLGTPRGWRHW